MDNIKEVIENLSVFILWGSVIWFWVISFALLIGFFIWDRVEDGVGAFVSFLIFIGVIHFWSNFDILSYLSWTIIWTYLGIGLIHAFIRTYVYGSNQKNKVKSNLDYGMRLSLSSDEKGKEFTLDEVKIGLEEALDKNRGAYVDEIKGNVFRWWLLFPVSLLNWILSDLFRDVWNFAYGKLSRIFNSIFDLAYKV